MRSLRFLWPILALFAGPASGQAQPVPIRIATEGAYAPFNFTRSDGKLDGFEIELGSDLCGRAKLSCEFVQADWDGMIPALQAGKYHAIMTGVNITDRREKVIDFSVPYARGAGSFGVPKAGPLAELPGREQALDLDRDAATAQVTLSAMKILLKGRTVGVQTSTNQLAFLEKYLGDTIQIREYKTTEQHDLDLMAGRIDAIFASVLAVRATLEKPGFAAYTLAGPRLSGDVFGRGIAIGLRREQPALKRLFDDAIASAAADGTLRALSLKWFGTNITAGS